MHQEKVDQLLEFGLEGVDLIRARNVLQNHNWNLEAAVNSLLTGMTESTLNDAEPPPLIDLTGPDSEPFARPSAPSPPPLDEQIGHVSSGTSTLRPSTRDDPKQEWALVPASGPQLSQPQPQPHEASDIDRAIQASLNETFLNASQYTDPIPSERIRPPNRPVALRLTHPAQGDALVLQALYAVPQIRDALLGYVPVSDQIPSSDDYWRGTEVYPVGPDHKTPPAEASIHRMQRLFSFMALTHRAYLNVDSTVDAMSKLDELGWERSIKTRCSLIDVLSRAVVAREAMSHSGTVGRRLFRSLLEGETPIEVDAIPLRVSPQHNALFPCLFESISPRAFRELADVLVFDIDRTKAESERHDKSHREPFTYPSSVFLDQFMVSHETRVNDRMSKHRNAELELQLLRAKKKELLSPHNKDSLKSIRTTLRYLDTHAYAADSTRQASLEDLRSRLRAIADRLEEEAKVLEEQISTAESIMSETFVVSEPQHQEYELRAVIIDDGQYGRTHTLAYIQDPFGIWFRMNDLEIVQTRVEHALRDASGLHLGGGPCLLFYSRATVKESPQTIDPGEMVQEPYRTQVYEDNARFAQEISGTMCMNDGLQHRASAVATEKVGETMEVSVNGAEHAVSMDIDMPPGLVRLA
ncbi:hypothetical protein CALVIDRAFT_407539 [Calocera viscosa TUFC12733]|uniref:UBA domain-containing protein n=1 Tax=Calocera viscosa (strain TUFC12733) TaxID=1330018 RepID=A0A167PZ92_CALVF|nr:hypothetical protein CALVIDRAFT_407539 [Calocera viscosa TUFC12733]